MGTTGAVTTGAATIGADTIGAGEVGADAVGADMFVTRVGLRLRLWTRAVDVAIMGDWRGEDMWALCSIDG